MKAFGWLTAASLSAMTLGLLSTSVATQKNVGAFLEVPAKTDGKQGEVVRRSKKPDPFPRTEVQATYGKLPLHFEVNEGQADAPVKFLAQGNGYTLFLASTEAVLLLRKPHTNALATIPGERARVRGPGPQQPEEPNQTRQSEERDTTVVRMQFVGGNPAPHVMGLERLPGKVNYFIGNDSTKWRADIPTYAQVEYRDIYPGVNLVYYGHQRQLEYDLVVNPIRIPT